MKESNAQAATVGGGLRAYRPAIYGEVDRRQAALGARLGHCNITALMGVVGCDIRSNCTLDLKCSLFSSRLVVYLLCGVTFLSSPSNSCQSVIKHELFWMILSQLVSLPSFVSTRLDRPSAGRALQGCIV